MKITDKLTITNEDNMALMARYPDNYFELAIVDPPYGIGASNMQLGPDYGHKRKWKKGKDWDDSIPNIKYFNELFRVSKNQIIWGGNYFTEFLNPSKCWIFWDKGVGEGMSFADGELAWSNINKPLKKIRIDHTGFRISETKQHPTQKPVSLYKWLLDKYAKPEDKILDTHLGSGSIALACHDYGFELTACELDTEYYEKAVERIKNHVAQQKLF